jgi:hypothetical protein
VFCLEAIRPGASVCAHCGSPLGPLQRFADERAALEQRIAALEQDVASLRLASDEKGAVEEQSLSAHSDAATRASRPETTWPHMVDNIFLGLTALLAAHWLATTLPASSRATFRLVALVVALPFGFRFERNARSGTAGQVVAALGFGGFGTVAIGVLDLALADHHPQSLTAQDVVASVGAISLSHFAGSALAHARRMRAERATNEATVARMAVSSTRAGATGSLMGIEPARIKSTAETVKALYEAAAPFAAGAAALWAAFGHMLF